MSGILAFTVITVALYVTATRGEAAVGGAPAGGPGEPGGGVSDHHQERLHA